jgi:hypothetical protein
MVIVEAHVMDGLSRRIVQAPEPCRPVAEEMDAFAADVAHALLASERENTAFRARIEPWKRQ